MKKVSELKTAGGFPDVDRFTIVQICCALAEAVDGKTVYTVGHSTRVSDYSVMVGVEMGFSGEDLFMLRLGALLHDLGKINIPKEVLDKPGELTVEEWEQIRDHPITGAKILERVDFFKELVPVVYHHHEYHNGRGYPGELSGSDIPVQSRIIAVADAYEAMTSTRPYRKGFSHHGAISMLREAKGWQFDPDVVDSFIKSIKKLKDLRRV